MIRLAFLFLSLISCIKQDISKSTLVNEQDYKSKIQALLNNDETNKFLKQVINHERKYNNQLCKEFKFLTQYTKNLYTQNKSKDFDNKIISNINENYKNFSDIYKTIKSHFKIADLDSGDIDISALYNRMDINFQTIAANPKKFFTLLETLDLNKINCDTYFPLLDIKKHRTEILNSLDMIRLLALETTILSLFFDKPIYEIYDIKKFYNNDVLKNSAIFHLTDIIPKKNDYLSNLLKNESLKHFIFKAEEDVRLLFVHTGYVFGGFPKNDYLKLKGKKEHLLPYDCSAFIYNILNLPSFDTRGALQIYNILSGQGYVLAHFLEFYNQNIEIFKQKLSPVLTFDDIKPGDILYYRKMTNRSPDSQILGQNGHVVIILDYNPATHDAFVFSVQKEDEDQNSTLPHVANFAGLMYENINLKNNDHHYRYILQNNENPNLSVYTYILRYNDKKTK